MPIKPLSRSFSTPSASIYPQRPSQTVTMHARQPDAPTATQNDVVLSPQTSSATVT
eukprot:COSAG06_NODE_49992_length_321_cov_1.391892_1_plen_55_part_10